MSSNAPKFKSIKFTGMKTNRKLFNVETSHAKPTPHYKPRFYTNKNLFYVKNCRKYYSNKNKNKLKLNFTKNQKKLLARRELRRKHCLFITQQFKPANSLLVKKEGQSTRPIIKFKKRLKFKVSTSKEKTQIKTTNEDININKVNVQKTSIVNNNSTTIISQFRHISKIQNNKRNDNLTYSEEDNFFSLSNNNTSIKPNQEKTKFAIGRWHSSEHKRFLEAIIKYGNDWKKVENHIGTRTSSQARSHAQKFFIKLKEEQKKSKISSDIDYSNSTIKTFHDALESMNPEKRENIIKELENVVFDNQTGMKSKRRRKSKNNCFSDSCTDGFISGTEFLEEYTIFMDDKNDNRKMSVDSEEKEEKKDKRKFKEEKNDMFTDEEYEKSFHKIFMDKEVDKIEPESRKQSIEDDFMFNINI